ncbi:hypothetical protein AXK11_07620 [Cephaloticoccus primus]|uniref:phosphoglycolate phosphatase n=1 Tax=Cephaloticoccus primus TaxID=1548207 RepID=A0A139SJM4_9BACT|nr:HAD hydrolase-like protein [Cephaloticoccus primus]KXU34704.1 hypothetical protein AXK11_07620 [Cephaloticoccus primus]
MDTLLLWDIDGTIIAGRGAGVRAMERGFQKAFGQDCDLGVVDWAGRTDKWITRAVLEHFKIEPSEANIARYLDAYLEVLDEELTRGPGELLPGVIGLLDTFHANPRVAQGLLTGNLRAGAQLKLARYDAWHYFSFGAFADDSALRNELGPHALRRAQAANGGRAFAPERCFIIGDTPRDIECARVIGAQAIAVATGTFTLAELASHSPTLALADLSDPSEFLQTILG